MKKFILSLFTAAILISACQPKTESVTANPAAEKDSIGMNLDAIYMAYTSKNTEAILSTLTDDCLYCGTDSKEFWDKESYAKLINEMSNDTAYTPPAFKVLNREVILDKTGSTAISVDQVIIEGWTDKIPVRNVAHHVKVDNKWMIDFISMSFVPNNEDLSKIFEAVSK
jgi:hypothetical protein